MAMYDQSLAIKITAAFSVIMFVLDVINSLCSILNFFQNQNSRTVGCGLCPLTSSVTSLLTITMLSIKFWFAVVTQMDIFIPRSVLQDGRSECLQRSQF